LSKIKPIPETLFLFISIGGLNNFTERNERMRSLCLIAALLGGLAVAAGAFGAHALRARLPAELLAIFETAARYQMYHALAIFAALWLASRGADPALNAGWCFAAGTLIFSGSLYVLALSGVRAWGAVTPWGGLLLLIGWGLLAVAAWRARW
jgi:uncharacterized membrane protein YgdD (TMEM256/DUF423 family)